MYVIVYIDVCWRFVTLCTLYASLDFIISCSLLLAINWKMSGRKKLSQQTLFMPVGENGAFRLVMIAMFEHLPFFVRHPFKRPCSLLDFVAVQIYLFTDGIVLEFFIEHVMSLLPKRRSNLVIPTRFVAIKTFFYYANFCKHRLFWHRAVWQTESAVLSRRTICRALVCYKLKYELAYLETWIPISEWVFEMFCQTHTSNK